MWNLCLEFARRQSREEMRRQFTAFARMEVRRRLLAVLPYAVATLYLPVWLCVLLMVLDIALESIAVRILGGTDPYRAPRRYLLSLACFMGSQAMYMLVPALLWQSPDEFAKSFAVGLFVVNLIHLSTVRSIHIPLARVGLAVALAITLVANTWYWVTAGKPIGLGITTALILAASYFTLMTMTTVYQLHLEMLHDKQAAEDANAAKSRFLAQMSHELRTPLNAILGMGFAELASAGSPDSKERLSTLVQSARGLSVLLNDILDLSTVQAGQLPIRPTVVDLRAETEATVALFRQQATEAGLSLTIAFDDHVPAHTRIDGQRMRQCLSNVLSNAIKFTRSGGINVAVSLPEPGLIVLEVSDTGPGVPKAMQGLIFEPFQRGDTEVTGTGLGLSISRTLARRMGGDLVLVPTRTGARFRMTFALEPATPEDMAAPAPDALTDLGGRRVLVVDDIATNRLVAMTYLSLMNAVPQEADSGEAALTLLEEEFPDVILLDMVMPGLDGIATMARIRAMPWPCPIIPVIAMTADATEDHRHAYLSAGANGYVTKPVSPEALAVAIRSVLAPKPPENDITRRN